jgi:formamidopyrimidine-DNA glycosylase
MLDGIGAGRLRARVKGKSFRSTRRHGKFLFVSVGKDDWLILHFGMTGYLSYFKDPSDEPDHTRLLIRFSNGYNLAYSCQRKLGRIAMTDDVDEYIEKQNLGPDALAEALDLDAFEEVITAHRSMLKSSLMSQDKLAGVGNIYSDETLFQAGVHPQSQTTRLDHGDVRNVYQSMRRVLRKAIDWHVDPDRFPRHYLIRHREPKTECPKCGGTIQKRTVAGRSAYFCKDHQKKIA